MRSKSMTRGVQNRAIPTGCTAPAKNSEGSLASCTIQLTGLTIRPTAVQRWLARHDARETPIGMRLASRPLTGLVVFRRELKSECYVSSGSNDRSSAMPHDDREKTQIEEVLDYLLRETDRLKRVCDLYGFGSISASLEMAMAEAKRLVASEPDAELTKH
jgi:hypothetical protein